MPKLETIVTAVLGIMNLSALNAIMAIGILVMAIGIYRSGPVIDKLKHRNARDHVRETSMISEGIQQADHH